VIKMTAAHQAGATSPFHVPHDRRNRAYWAAGVVALAGLLVATGLAVFGLLASHNAPDDLVRAGIPGAVTLEVDDSGTRYIYYEGDTTPDADTLGLSVVAPDGTSVDVEDYDLTLEYDAADGTLGSAVASFEAEQTGPYAVAATGTQTGSFAVGESVADPFLSTLLQAGVVLLVTTTAAVFIVIRTARRS
jgi:hypothetical protein